MSHRDARKQRDFHPRSHTKRHEGSSLLRASSCGFVDDLSEELPKPSRRRASALFLGLPLYLYLTWQNLFDEDMFAGVGGQHDPRGRGLRAGRQRRRRQFDP